MRLLFTLSLFTGILFCSCHQKAKRQPHQQNLPQALQENKSTEVSFSKRGADDLIEELYDELKTSTPALQQLDEKIKRVRDQQKDSVKPFESFDNKNNKYYNATGSYTERIHDSLLRSGVKLLIDSSLQVYKSRTGSNRRLIEMLENKNINLGDLYTILKLTKTLAIMEKYQQTNQPGTQPLQAVNQEYDKIILETGKLKSK